jgi:hypothetical protein
MINWYDAVNESDIIMLRILHDLSFENIQPVLEKIEALETKYVNGFNRFTNLNDVQNMNLTSDEIWNISQRRAMMYKGPVVKSAFFSSDKLMFGMMRIYATMMEPSPIDVDVFDDLNECADWLGFPSEMLEVDTMEFMTI